MRNPFKFEAEPFEFYSEFDEYEEEQSAAYSEFDQGYESDFEVEPFETYPEYEEAELVDEYSGPESFEAWKLKKRSLKKPKKSLC